MRGRNISNGSSNLKLLCDGCVVKCTFLTLLVARIMAHFAFGGGDADGDGNIMQTSHKLTILESHNYGF